MANGYLPSPLALLCAVVLALIVVLAIKAF
jgi:hypothetical protein